MGGHRASRAFGSNVVQRTAIPGAAIATPAQVLAANPSRALVSLLNKTDAVVKVFINTLVEKQAENAGAGWQTVELAIGGYWEDPGNYQGAITIEGGTTGFVIATEWL